jgi:hypothetical protein
MANPNRQQGSDYEKKWVDRLEGWGLHDVEWLRQGGSKDRGDVRFRDPWGNVWMLEAKAAGALSVTKELADAKEAAQHERRQVTGVFLAWKRIVGRRGEGPRQPLGEREVVVMDVDTFRTLLELAGATRDADRRRW